MQDKTINSLAKTFLDNPSENNALNLTRTLRLSGKHHTNFLIGSHFLKIYSHNLEIREEVAISAFYSSNYNLSYKLYSKNLECRNLDEKASEWFNYCRHFSSQYICNNYVSYNPEIISKIKKNSTFPLITFTITTCKRFDLFEKTMNSFLNCCKDIEKINEWLCVDDNSSDEDREKMKRLYPFFTFYLKTKEEKGHARSMNIIKNNVNTPYIFHMEDDWKFFEKRNYISDCMEVLGSDNSIGQCLINKNYAEEIKDIDIVGGLFKKTNLGLRYFIHEYTADKKSQDEFIIKYKNVQSCAYWPHFSFRPSLLRKSVIDTIGEYSETASHFEMDYANRYVSNGYVSAFLEGIYCLHIGRLTSQLYNKSIPNAYDLNNEIQFDEKIPKNKECIIISSVINLDKRKDRMDIINNICPIKFNRFSAINGDRLKPNKQLNKIFEGNDYNMRAGMVGCAMSHIKLCIDLLETPDNINTFCIMEDDITFVPNFVSKFSNVINQIHDTDWDLVYLGHHLYPSYKDYKPENYTENQTDVILEKWDTTKSLKISVGGAFGYLISRKGIHKLLNFINKTGMTNGIDTVQQKAITGADMNTYYCFPHLIRSDYVCSNNLINSDIQYDFKSLTLNYADNMFDEYLLRLMKNDKFNVDDALVYND